MKLATYSTGGERRIGVITSAGIVPVSDEPGMPTDMMELIERWPELEARVRTIANQARTGLSIDTVQLHAPVSRPSKIMAIGLNYADHVAESGLEAPTRQLWFAKQVNTINGPHDGVQIPTASEQIDYEVELVAVIGKRGRHISVEDAPAHVFGYCVGNDVSVRDWQLATPQWVLGKSFDSHAPIGPYITTGDEVGDPHRLSIRSIVNGEVRQSSNTRHLIFNVWDQIAHLSEAMTLEPGDLIFTGTPGGVGLAMRPPRFLASGDVVRCEIEELGAIENQMVPE
jgi:2-keto-4-pentenoate hydratase/2-oxohepta-3-ene-1,7-dioic acid hydratase in catechol pathway